MDVLIPILAAAVRSGTPVAYAVMGEILAERSGVMNLGLEGLMLFGAFAGFSATRFTGSPELGLAAAFAAGALVTLIHAFLCVTLGGNQTVSGLALAMFGGGMSAMLGRNHIGETIKGLMPFDFPVLCRIPLIGPVFFRHDVMVYISFLLVFSLSFFIFRTRPGINLRAVGENPRAADAMGISVSRVRYLYTLAGGGLAGLAGGYLSVVYSQMWVEGMTAGRGWIAVALVIFGIWRPLRAMFGCYLFGGIDALQLRMQAAGTSIPAPILLMLPYLMTLGVLVFISIRSKSGILLGAPASLGAPFRREERE
ncbi:MAG: ABC transporter permease [Synergistaceae bacterium]|jgi:simple sugar transport system permease protein|nr:ABC transporter permease [Synergistaceae bacterium]